MTLDWPIPPADKITKAYRLSSGLTLAAVGILSRIWITWFNRVNVHGKSILYDALENRPADQGLVTVCNHYSCMDDPLIWGILRWRHLMNHELMRWSAGAHDIVFTKQFHMTFFSRGKVVPIVRGDGVYQKCLDFLLEQLDNGQWVHMFPEGKVNMTQESTRLKWGVGRLIGECQKTPLVIPMWFTGTDDILPNFTPYIPRFGKKVTVLIGKPLEFATDLQLLIENRKTPREIRKFITDRIQDELSRMKVISEQLHLENKDPSR